MGFRFSTGNFRFRRKHPFQNLLPNPPLRVCTLSTFEESSEGEKFGFNPTDFAAGCAWKVFDGMPQSSVDQLKDSNRQLEREKALRQEEVEKEVNNVKFEVESKRRALELRNSQLESLVAEVGWSYEVDGQTH